MVDPDGTLDALASLSLSSPTKVPTAKATPPSAASPAKESLPEILPGPDGLAASTRVQSSAASTEGRENLVGLGLAGVVGLPFSRRRPSGEEAIAQKWTAALLDEKLINMSMD